MQNNCNSIRLPFVPITATEISPSPNGYQAIQTTRALPGRKVVTVTTAGIQQEKQDPPLAPPPTPPPRPWELGVPLSYQSTVPVP